MSFCKFSPSFSKNNKTVIDNRFITDFLPKAPDMCVKVYLLGLQKCNDADDSFNSLNMFAETLKICENDVVSCFKYWEDQGLVQVLSTEPVEVRYLPITSSSVGIKKFDVDKYTSFNIQVQEAFNKRMVMPNDYADMYNLIEKHHIAENALLEIIKYCVNMKGFNLSPQYCITVAKDWEKEGVHTLEDVNEKIKELGIVDDKLAMIFKLMKTERKVQLEDKELLNKWLNFYGFELNVILYVIKSLNEKKRRLDINILDNQLAKYFEMHLMSTQEIEAYEQEKEQMYFVAIAVNKELGIYYEDLTKEIDSYVVSWLNMGFDLETLKVIADNCFKSSIRTLEGFNNIIIKLFKLGIVNLNSYQQYMNDSLAEDSKIREVLDALGLARNVINADRTLYRVWTEEWKFSHEIIIYGASLATLKTNAIQYLNKILLNWKDQGALTIDQVKKSSFVQETNNDKFLHNNYSKEQIISLITNLDEVEV